MTLARGSLTAPLARALFEQETVVRATIQALLDAFAEKSALDAMLVLLLLLLLCFVVEVAAVFVNVCFSKASDLTRPGQGPANFPNKSTHVWAPGPAPGPGPGPRGP